jgi:hypothetical protein
MVSARGPPMRGTERRSPSDPGVCRRPRRRTFIPRALARERSVVGRSVTGHATGRAWRGQHRRSLPAHPRSRRSRRHRLRRHRHRLFRHRLRRRHDQLLARLGFPLASCPRRPHPGRPSSRDDAAVFVLPPRSALCTRRAPRSSCHPAAVAGRRAVVTIVRAQKREAGSVRAGRSGLPGLAPTCRCERGAIPYAEDGATSCAKCGRALEPATADTQTGASIGVEERTGCPPPGPSPELAARPNGRDRARPPDAEPPPAPTLAPQAGSGESFDWPFRPGASTGPGRPGGAA